MDSKDQREDKILIVAATDSFRNGMRGILESEGYKVFTRQSIERCIQLLELSDISLVVCDNKLEDGTSLDFLKELKEVDAYYSDTPVYCVGKDKTAESIACFEAGADEFSSKPLNKKNFQARVKNILRRIHKQRTSKVTLESRIETSELPGVLQYLEAEVKSGVLKTVHKKEKGEITFKTGKVVKAETEFCAAQDAITEILSWPFVHLRFIETHVEGDFDLSLDISSTLMDCVFEVDEFKEVLKRLPNLEVSFVSGGKPLPKNSNRVAKKVHRMACSGTILEEILTLIKINRRHLLTLIDQLVQMDYLVLAEPPFKDYLEEQKKQYENQGFFKMAIPDLLNSCTDLSDDNLKDLKTFSFSASNSISTESPRIFIAGDHPELNDILFSTLQQLAANSCGTKSKTSSTRTHEALTTLNFSNSASLQVHKLPPKLDSHYLKQLDPKMHETAAVFFIASAQDRDTSRINRRQLKLLRGHFKGAYYVIIPKLCHDDPSLKIDCQYCQHKLSINIDLSGSLGSCPICNTELTIPECLEHSASCLNLTPEVPCVFMSPATPHESNGLLKLCFNSLLNSFQG